MTGFSLLGPQTSLTGSKSKKISKAELKRGKEGPGSISPPVLWLLMEKGEEESVEEEHEEAAGKTMKKRGRSVKRRR